MQGQVLLLRLCIIKLAIVVLVLMLDAIGVRTMSTKHRFVVLGSRRNMSFSRFRVGGHGGTVSSRCAVMCLSRGYEMPSSWSGSHGMINVRRYWVNPDDLSVVRWMIMKHDLFVVVDVMW